MAETTPTSAAHTGTDDTATAKRDEMKDSSERETLLENAIGSTEKILQLRESFNELIENGLLELARVRYSTGNKSVSALQLNMSEVEALRTVRSNFDDPDQLYPSFELLHPDSTGGTTNKEVEVRQRRQAEEPSTEAAQSPSQRPTSRSDPLRWFGVLVPQSLRRSQKNFVSALEVVVDVANEQSRLAAALDAYRASQPAAQSAREAEP